MSVDPKSITDLRSGVRVVRFSTFATISTNSSRRPVSVTIPKGQKLPSARAGRRIPLDSKRRDALLVDHLVGTDE
jgi:hypothetical protein